MSAYLKEDLCMIVRSALYDFKSPSAISKGKSTTYLLFNLTDSWRVRYRQRWDSKSVRVPTCYLQVTRFRQVSWNLIRISLHNRYILTMYYPPLIFHIFLQFFWDCAVKSTNNTPGYGCFGFCSIHTKRTSSIFFIVIPITLRFCLKLYGVRFFWFWESSSANITFLNFEEFI